MFLKLCPVGRKTLTQSIVVENISSTNFLVNIYLYYGCMLHLIMAFASTHLYKLSTISAVLSVCIYS